MATRSFEFREGTSDKFWTISVNGTSHVIRFGRNGTAGQEQIKEFASADAANKAYDKLIAEKLKKGYREVGGTATQVPVAAGVVRSEAPASQRAAAMALASTPAVRLATATIGAPSALTASGAMATQPPSEPAAAMVPSPTAAATATIGAPSAPTPGGAIATLPPSKPAAATVLSSTAATTATIVASLPAKPPAPATPLPQRPDTPGNPAGLHLSPADMLYATWRPRPHRDRPPAIPFDEAATRKRIARVLSTRYYFQIEWDDAGMSPSMSAEEARLWLSGMRLVHERGTDYTGLGPAALLRKHEEVDWSVTPPIEAVRKSFNQSLVSSAPLLPLSILYPWDEVARLIGDLEAPQQGYWIRKSHNTFRTSLLPFLSEDELETLRQAVIASLTNHGRRVILSSQLVPLVGIHSYIRQLMATQGDNVPQEYLFGLDDPKLMASEMVRRKATLRDDNDVTAWLAHTELTHLSWITDSILLTSQKDDAEAASKQFAKLVSSPVAAGEFLRLAESGKGSLPAKSWFEANPQAALEGLESEKLTSSVRAMLQTLRRKLSVEPADEARSPLDRLPSGLEEAFAAVRGRRLKPPRWVSATELPYIEVGEGRLKDDDVTLLLAVLSSAEPRPPHPLLLALRCYAEPEALDAFAEALFNSWRQAGMPGKEKWALLAMGAIGSDRSALRIAPYVREWPGESKHQAATWGLEVLRGIGTDTAIMQINLIAQKAKFQALKKNAQETMESIAEDRGLTRDELEDRIVPDCGLDERGTRIFDFGPRQFRLRIGPNMKPSVIDGDNVRRDDLPKPTQKDDAALAEAAVAQWKLAKKQVSEVVKVQVARLENALVTQRRWTAADFEVLLVRHPLVSQIMRPLVWGVFDSDNNLLSTFRVTEEQQYADVQDNEFRLPAEGIIGLPHPAKLDPAVMSAWGEVLSDYELIPPFAQLGRSIYKLEPHELDKEEIVRHTDVSLQPIVFAGICKRLGYLHGQVQDGGSYFTHTKWFPTMKLTAVMHHTWLSIGYFDTDPVSIEKVYFVPRAYERGNWAEDHSDKIKLRDVDPTIVSEILADLYVLASRAEKEEK